MKRFRLLSDLHLEFLGQRERNELFTRIRNYQILTPCNYLVLAGDVTTPTEKNSLKELLSATTDQYNHIFYVLGNHEFYWRCNVLQQFSSICREFDNVKLLHNETYSDGAITVFGGTLWSDITESAFISMSDSHYMSLKDYLLRHQETRTALENLPENGVDLIITHHMPSMAFCLPKYERYARMNSGFASSCEDLFGKTKSHWVFGHTHSPIKRELAGKQFLCNPLGYPGENKDFLDVTFEI